MSSKRISFSWLLPHGTPGLIRWKEKALTSLLNLLFPDEDSEDAMSEVSSECPSEYYCWYDSENQSGTAELPREKRTRE